MKLGIDLGGTKIEAVLLDPEGLEHWRKRVPTPQGNYGQTLDLIAALVHEARDFVHIFAGEFARDFEKGLALSQQAAGESQTMQLSIGIGTPGATSQLTGLIKNANSTCLNAKPLQ